MPTRKGTHALRALASVLLLAALATGGAAVGGCAGAGSNDASGEATLPTVRPAAGPTKSLVTLTVLGTNDIHGAIDRLPAIGAVVDAVRKERESQGGGVILLDGGDMFQGTLESNLGEGEGIVELMNAIGYTAAAVGNHEFDYGPVGPHATPQSAGEDPRGALEARAAGAEFPFVASNITDEAGKPLGWRNMPAVHAVAVAGVRVGIIGLSTVETPTTTIKANLTGLRFQPLAPTVERLARQLRAGGAQVVLVTAHAGGSCEAFFNPEDLSSCDPHQEIFELARTLPPGTVDAIVAGHTHRGVAHVVNGIPIIEQFAHGSYVGRIDLAVAPERGQVVAHRVFPPQPVCRDPGAPRCEPITEYQGRPVTVSSNLSAITARWEERAQEVRDAPLGVVATHPIERSFGFESAMGNWIADLMLAAHPADVALTNGGGLRAAIDAGPITYGDLFRVQPFDNLFVVVNMTGAQLEKVMAANLEDDDGILSVAGITVDSRCQDGKLDVTLRRNGGEVIGDDETIDVVTSDFLATTGAPLLAAGRVTPVGGTTLRDGIAAVLRSRGGTVDGAAASLYDPKHPRVRFPGKRPVRCQ